MGRLADEVGVSRQTVYNEMGSKQALAEAMIHAEFTRFLAVVDHAFDASPDDLVQSIRAAARDVLDLAHGNAQRGRPGGRPGGRSGGSTVTPTRIPFITWLRRTGPRGPKHLLAVPFHARGRGRGPEPGIIRRKMSATS